MKFRNPKRLASQQVGNPYPTSAVQRRKARLLSPPGFHPLDRFLRRKEPFVLRSYHQCNKAADQESIWLDPLNTEDVYKGIVLYPLTKQKELVSSVHSTLTEYQAPLEWSVPSLCRVTLPNGYKLWTFKKWNNAPLHFLDYSTHHCSCKGVQDHEIYKHCGRRKPVFLSFLQDTVMPLVLFKHSICRLTHMVIFHCCCVYINE